MSTTVTARHLKKLYLQTGGMGGNIINVNGTHHRVQPSSPSSSIALFTVEDLAASQHDCLDFKKGQKYWRGEKIEEFFFFSRQKKSVDES